MLVDSHFHLDMDAYDGERDAVVARAKAAGVGVLHSISTRLSTVPALLDLVRRHDDVYASVGVHPHQAGEEGVDDPAPILALTHDPRVIGIGESGLDHFYDNAPRDRQAASFRAHVHAAQLSRLPLIVHTRDADADTLRILQDAMDDAPFTGEVHCYSTSPELGFAAVEMGLYLGIGGILTFRRSDALRKTVRELPLDRLLLETDAPFLAPTPHRGGRNEPAYVLRVAEVLAEVKGVSVGAIAEATTDNFFRLFPRARRPAA